MPTPVEIAAQIDSLNEELIESLKQLPRWENTCDCGRDKNNRKSRFKNARYIQKPWYVCLICGGNV